LLVSELKPEVYMTEVRAMGKISNKRTDKQTKVKHVTKCNIPLAYFNRGR
jgi:hypothetical protein